MKKIISCFILLFLILCMGITVNARGKEKWSSSSNLKKYENVDTEFRAVWVCTVGNMDVKKHTLQSLRKMIAIDRKTLPKEKWPVIYDISTLGAYFFNNRRGSGLGLASF